MISPCGVCNSQDPKYKCSICFLPYCSVPCYATHKDSENCKRPEKHELDDSTNEKNEEATRYFSEDMIPPDTLKKLDESKKLKNLLKDVDLRQMLLAVDNADDAGSAMSKAMKHPIFVEFADECLKIVKDTES